MWKSLYSFCDCVQQGCMPNKLLTGLDSRFPGSSTHCLCHRPLEGLVVTSSNGMLAGTVGGPYDSGRWAHLREGCHPNLAAATNRLPCHREAIGSHPHCAQRSHQERHFNQPGPVAQDGHARQAVKWEPVDHTQILLLYQGVLPIIQACNLLHVQAGGSTHHVATLCSTIAVLGLTAACRHSTVCTWLMLQVASQLQRQSMSVSGTANCVQPSTDMFTALYIPLAHTSSILLYMALTVFMSSVLCMVAGGS